MSTVNYTIVAFDDELNEYVVTYDGGRINVPVVSIDGVTDSALTTRAIKVAIKIVLAGTQSVVTNPTGYDALIGNTGTVNTTEEV
jgi:hypothetical protein